MLPAEKRTLVLRPSKRRAVLYLLLCLALTVMDVFVIVGGGKVIGWFGVVFFGAGVLIFVVQLIPGASYLHLAPDGFVVCSLFRKWPVIRWEDVSEFQVASVPPSRMKMIVFDWAQAPKPQLRKINRALVGAGDALPDTYGLEPQELADIMNDWRSAFTGRC
jgi:hypothetical protein